MAQDCAPNTINLTLAALRGGAREAWNLAYMTAEDSSASRMSGAFFITSNSD